MSSPEFCSKIQKDGEGMENQKVNIQEYIDLYNKSIPITNIKPLEGQTFKIFKLSGTDIRIGNRNLVYEDSNAFQKIKYFILKNEYFYMVPMTTVKGTIVGFIIRGVFTSDYSTITKSFSGFQSQVPIMYGFDRQFAEYDKGKKCYPIVVCEGCKDAMTLKKMYPYVLSNNTSSMGTNANILRNISNKFLLAYDNDKAGEDGMNKDKDILRAMGAYVDSIKLPEGVKDCTDYIINPVTCELSKENFSKLRDQMSKKLKSLYEI